MRLIPALFRNSPPTGALPVMDDVKSEARPARSHCSSSQPLIRVPVIGCPIRRSLVRCLLLATPTVTRPVRRGRQHLWMAAAIMASLIAAIIGIWNFSRAAGDPQEKYQIECYDALGDGVVPS